SVGRVSSGLSRVFAGWYAGPLDAGETNTRIRPADAGFLAPNVRSLAGAAKHRLPHLGKQRPIHSYVADLVLDASGTHHDSHGSGDGFHTGGVLVGIARVSAGACGNVQHSRVAGRIPAGDCLLTSGAGPGFASWRDRRNLCEETSLGMRATSMQMGRFLNYRLAGWGTLLMVLGILPWLGISSNLTRLLFTALVWIIASVAWNLLGGVTGQVPSGFAVFYGLRAYAAAMGINGGLHPLAAFTFSG